MCHDYMCHDDLFIYKRKRKCHDALFNYKR